MPRMHGPSSADETAPAPNATDGRDAGEEWGAFWLGSMGQEQFVPFAETSSIGRDHTCVVVLDGGDVSRHHATIRRDGPLFVLSDRESRNGTFVNGVALGSQPVCLRLGDVIRIGGWVGVVARALEGVSMEFERRAGGTILGPSMRYALAPALLEAAKSLPIILEGETGSGKEVAARLLHEASGRPGPFVAVNCAAIPESLAEAELFGFRKAAFTGAARDQEGHFRAADGGTLLLDEIIDLPAAIQSKLLRVIEQREVVPLGESHPVKVDVGIVVAAQEGLARAVAQKRFRGDLHARLDGMTVALPALRHRREEIPVLFRHFLASAAPGEPPALSPRLLERLCVYDWPFNVRELAQLARRMRASTQGQSLLCSTQLPTEMVDDARRGPASDLVASPAPDGALAGLAEALRRCDGNVSLAAEHLGISRGKAYRLIKKANLQPLARKARS